MMSGHVGLTETDPSARLVPKVCLYDNAFHRISMSTRLIGLKGTGRVCDVQMEVYLLFFIIGNELGAE